VIRGSGLGSSDRSYCPALAGLQYVVSGFSRTFG
jgi:hypothetical protein